MAQSPCPTRQYTSENFIESCGAIAHDPTRQKICLIHLAQSNMWVLPKGRRNVGEAHREAALREVYEETGAGETKGPGEEGVETGLFSYPDAEELLFYETDREVLRKAKGLVGNLD
ncbi:unnamed protein product [Alternaria alternata]